MMFTIVSLLASLVAAQSSTPFWSLDLSDRNVLSVDAEVYIHVQVDDVFYKKTANTTVDRVVFSFGDGGLLLPIKDRLEDEAASEKNLAKPYLFSDATCVALNLNATGAVSLASPAVIIDDHDTYIYQWADYADYVMYADFHRPFFEFEVSAFTKGNANSSSCTPTAGDGAVAKQNFTERLCFQEDTFCNFWIGDKSDGWLYFGGGNTSTTANFGVHVQPRWNWSGSRESFVINDTNLIDVRPVDSSSDAVGKFTLSRTYSVPFEFEKCNITDDGAVVFNINANGFLERYLSCNSLILSDYAYFVFDFKNKFVEANLNQFKLPTTPEGDRWNFTLTTVRVKYANTFNVRIDPENYLEPYVKLNRLPAGYELDGYNWLTTIEYRTSPQFDLIKTWFTVIKPAANAPVTTPTTSTSTTRPAPTAPALPCPQGCNGAGTCNPSTGVCACDTGFVVDSVVGCKALAETTTAAAPGATTTTLKQVAVDTLSVSQAPTVPQTQETAAVTEDPNKFTGTFTGTKAPTAPPRTRAPATNGTTATASAANVVVSAAAVLLSTAVVVLF